MTNAIPLIDCDIHPEATAENPLDPFVPASAREGLRQGLGGMPGMGYTNPFGVTRRDAECRDPLKVGRDHLDKYGIRYGILQPPGMKVSLTLQPDMGSALARAWNDWQINPWLAADRRFLGSVCVNVNDQAEAVKEIRRAGEHPQMVQVNGAGAAAGAAAVAVAGGGEMSAPKPTDTPLPIDTSYGMEDRSVDQAFKIAFQAQPPKSRNGRRLTICAASKLPPGSRRIVEVPGHSIGVFNIEGTFHATRNVCPHDGAPLCQRSVHATHPPAEVHQFEPALHGRVLRCPWHGWEFDIPSGKGLYDKNSKVMTYPVEVDARGDVVVTV